MGDAFLAPAYDLINTRLHVDDSDLALTDGLYPGDFKHPSYAGYGSYAYDDFFDFGKRIGLIPIRIKRLIAHFVNKEEAVSGLVERSFLNEKSKMKYIELYRDKNSRLAQSLTGLTGSKEKAGK